jgi:hypothetical protein
MGRTIPTATMLIQEEIDLFLRTFGKGLSSDRERQALYNMLQFCKKHTQACSQAVRLVPFHAILMSLILEQQKQLELLTGEVMTLAPNHALRGELS